MQHQKIRERVIDAEMGQLGIGAVQVREPR